MNQSQIAGKWKEIKGEIRKAWGDLTDDEVEQTKGNMESISGLIQQKFGLTKEQASERLNKVYGKFDSATENVKDSLRESNTRDRDRLN
ncbi:MAG: CsbD family protein [Bdellovibrionota bacterium]